MVPHGQTATCTYRVIQIILAAVLEAWGGVGRPPIRASGRFSAAWGAEAIALRRL